MLTIKVVKYQFNDILRSKWLIIYTLFFMSSTYGLVYFSGTGHKFILSVGNIFLFIVPFISIVYGTIYMYNNREYIIFMLSQPIKRQTLFLGLYFGVTFAQIISLTVGVALPLVFYCPFHKETMDYLFAIIALGIFNILIFTSLAFFISTFIENRLLGLGVSIFLWLAFAILFDGVLMILLFMFRNYPVEKPSAIISLLNPIDIGRLMLMLQLDVSALMGYTGAIFNKFFGSGLGLMVALTDMIVWSIFPLLLGLKRFIKKDF
ncbi:ABC transporter permease [Melioribacter sp. OK-6-Me]|uniref:ABC transporter permease n=1 Tax=unclassified Melioribacter TaxID=2627329 RepID=UPI003ED8F4DC